MIPELGNLALILALCLAILQGTLPLAGSLTGNARWVALARPVAIGDLHSCGFKLGPGDPELVLVPDQPTARH